MSTARPPSSSVAPYRSATRSSAGRRNRTDRPKSPWSAWVRKRQYWTLHGRSRPRCARMSSMSAFDASAGIMIWIGSPESRTSAKTTTDTTNTDTIDWITRPMMKRSMRLSSRGTPRTRRVSAGSARADVDAVARGPADAIARQPAQRMVERLHAHFGPATDLIDAELGPGHVVGRQVGIVDLHEESRIDDGLVLLVHRLGDRGEVFLLGLVVGVPLPVLDARGRDRRDEGFPGAASGQARLEVLDIGLDVLRARVDDRARAHHVQRPYGWARHRTREPLVELGERSHFARAAPRADPACRVGLEAGQALVDVRNEAGLAHLAVIDDVDAELGLLADDLPDRVSHPGGEGLLIVGAAGRLGLDQLEQVTRARQASGVGRQEAVGAPVHGRLARRGDVLVVVLEGHVGERLPASDLPAQRPRDRLHAQHDSVMRVVELLPQRLRQSGALVGVELPHRRLDVLVVLTVAQQVEGALRVQDAAPGQDRLVERRRAVDPVRLVRLPVAALGAEG